MQVYCVLYDRNGNFLIATERERGYYFYNDGGGTLVPDGQRLNGAGKPALPGGKKERDKTILAAAAREFEEETGQPVPTGTEPPAQQAWGDKYAAGYFCLSWDDLELVEATIADIHLPFGNCAADAVKSGSVKTYMELRDKYPKAPKDNELATVHIWNLKTDWPTIESWRNNPDLGWFYDILKHLKDKLRTNLGT